MKERGEGTVAYKGFHLIDGVPVCDRFGRETEYPFGMYVAVEGPLKLCANGIHFCTDPMDCLRFYPPNQPDNVIGVAEAFGVSDETEQWTTKRVARAICVKAKVDDMFDYQALTDVVKSRTVGTRTLHITECIAGSHTDVLNCDDRVWLYGIGWSIGDTSDILLSAGRSCLVAGDDICLCVAVAFGRNSVCVGDAAITMAPCCLARAIRAGGVALTVKDMSIAVAEAPKSVAIAKASFSRAVANNPISTAVATVSDSLVILNHPGCVGVSYGSARVNSQGCTIILVPSSYYLAGGRAVGSYYSGTGTLQGVDGTLVLVFDMQNLRWLSVRLRKGHKVYPSDRPLDIQWLVETVRRKAHENNPG